MTDLLTCFPNQVGITSRDCDCFPNADDSGFNITTSKSGLYLDQFIDLRDVAFERCGESNSVLQRMNRALEDSFKSISLDVADSLRNDLGYSHKGNYRGELGSLSWRTALSKPETYRGQKILPKHMVGGEIRVTGVSILLGETAEDFDLTFVNGNTGETVVKQVSSTADQWHSNTFAEAYTFSMDDLSGDADHGFIVYHQKTTTKNDKVDCGCGKAPAWTKYFKARGVRSNSNQVDDLFNSDSEYGHGIRLHIEVSCGIEAELCQFQGTQERALAEARVLISAINLLKEMTVTREVTKFTVYGEEDTRKVISGYQQEYWDRIKYLAQNAQGSDCFYCNPRVTKGRILV